MDEQYQDILNGMIILILIINTTVMFSLVSDRDHTGSLNSLVTTAGSNLDMNKTNVSAVSTTSTIATPVITKTPTPAPTPVPARKGNANIFYMQNARLDTSMPPIFLNLVNPPLIIDFDVVAMNITDEIPHDYKLISTDYHDIINLTHPYEEAVFKITVTNDDTGMVVVDDGYGLSYGLQSPKNIDVMTRGNYTIRASGNYVNVTLSIEVPKERNLP